MLNKQLKKRLHAPSLLMIIESLESNVSQGACCAKSQIKYSFPAILMVQLEVPYLQKVL